MASMLLDEMRKTMRRRHYSIRTERSHCGWVKPYVLFHKMRSRACLRDGEKKIEAFLNHLAIDLHVAPSTQDQAMNALVFLHKHVLKEPLDGAINAERAYVPAQFRHAPSSAGNRHTHDSGSSGAQGHLHHHGVYSYPAAGGTGGCEPA
jgi:hypothetical protein